MSQITIRQLMICIMVVILGTGVGCKSNPNKDNVLDTDTGQHKEGWLVDHRSAYHADPELCKECHGDDYKGGVSGVSCYSTSLNGTSCHGDIGPFGHPDGWASPNRHGAVAKKDLTRCVSCHANPSDASVGSNPRFNVAIGSLTNGCEDCHAANAAHPVPWQGPVYDHNTAANFTGACALCHGASLGGGSGPACTSCHTNGSPTDAFNCTSCHTKPPSGSVAPNRSGAHAIHNAFAGVTNVCDTCHSGAGSGTALHSNGVVDVAFLSNYNAKSGTATHNGDGTCSKVSCHGGQTTPVWLSGTIDVNTQCDSCHAYGTAEYNSYSSGQHAYHLTWSLTCVSCHDTTKLAVSHFTNLGTSALEGPASATIKSELNYSGGVCAPACHAVRSWQ